MALDHHDGTFERQFGRDEDKYRRIDGRWKFLHVTMEADSFLRGEFVDHGAFEGKPRIR